MNEGRKGRRKEGKKEGREEGRKGRRKEGKKEGRKDWPTVWRSYRYTMLDPSTEKMRDWQVSLWPPARFGWFEHRVL